MWVPIAACKHIFGFYYNPKLAASGEGYPLYFTLPFVHFQLPDFRLNFLSMLFFLAFVSRIMLNYYKLS